jgi:hypothetical protein
MRIGDWEIASVALAPSQCPHIIGSYLCTYVLRNSRVRGDERIFPGCVRVGLIPDP